MTPDVLERIFDPFFTTKEKGEDLANQMMSMRSDIPIILYTGFSDQIDEHKAKDMGISAFVMKPIVMRQIANTIREVLDKR